MHLLAEHTALTTSLDEILTSRTAVLGRTYTRSLVTLHNFFPKDCTDSHSHQGGLSSHSPPRPVRVCMCVCVCGCVHDCVDVCVM